MDFDADGLLKFLEEYNHVPDDGPYVFSSECVEDFQWVVVTSSYHWDGKAPSGKGGGKAPPPPVKGGKAGPGKGGPVPGKGKVGGKPPFGRKFNWKSIGVDALKNSIFEELDVDDKTPGSLDVNCIDSLFRPKSPKSKNPSFPSGGKGKGKTVDAKVQKVIFDPKKAQNMAILMRSCGTLTQFEERCEGMLRFDCKALPSSLLEHILHNILPQFEGDRQELLNYDGDLLTLREVERQCVMLLRIPRIEPRISILLFANTMEETANEMLVNIDAYKSAARQVRSSLSLRKIFRTILNIVNFLNYGIKETHLSTGVKGFELESLLKLSEFRSSQHSELSALHCVVVHLLQQVQTEREKQDEDNWENVSPSLWIENLKLELSYVFQIGKRNVIQVSDIQEAIDAYLRNVELVRSELNEHGDEYGDRGKEILSQLLNYSAENGDALKQDLDELLEEASKVLDFFATSKTPFQKFFETLAKFCEALESAWKEVLNNPKKLGKFLPTDTYTMEDPTPKSKNSNDNAGEKRGSEKPSSTMPGDKGRANRPSSDAIRRRKPVRSASQND